jgi:hypothetical protein
VQRLASRNPLLLGFLVCLSLDGIDLGETRAELYANIVGVIHRSPPNDREVVDVSERIATEVVNALGWKQANAPFCSSAEAIAFVSSHLAARFGLGALAADEAARAGVRFWEGRRLVETISARRDDAIIFAHLSLQEFAAARYAKGLETAAFLEWVREVRRKPAWKQVLLLLCGIDDDARTVSALLDLDDSSDPISCEALLVAEGIFEREPPGLTVVPQLLQALAKRLESPIPLVSIEAAQHLARLAPYAKEEVLAISRIDTTSNRWIDLGQFLLRLLVDNEKATVDDFKEWFRSHKPVRVHFPKVSLRDESEEIPEEARDLQNRIIQCGLERLIASHALNEVAAYFEAMGERSDLSSGLLEKIQNRLVDIGL